MVWCANDIYGTLWHSTAWYGVVWHGIVLCEKHIHSILWYTTHGMAECVWYGMVWFCMRKIGMAEEKAVVLHHDRVRATPPPHVPIRLCPHSLPANP